MKHGKKLLIASAIASMGLVAPQVSVVATGATGQSTQANSGVKNTGATKAFKNQVKAARLTSTGRYGYRWLMPVNKESFKQSRRKQLAKRSARKAKRNGQA